MEIDEPGGREFAGGADPKDPPRAAQPDPGGACSLPRTLCPGVGSSSNQWRGSAYLVARMQTVAGLTWAAMSSTDSSPPAASPAVVVILFLARNLRTRP